MRLDSCCCIHKMYFSIRCDANPFIGYTDDTQLYLHGRRDDMTSTTRRLENCITDVGQWMSTNRLKLNTEKTELLWAGSRHGQSSVTDCRPSLQLGADTVTAQDDVRLLGVTISSDLSLLCHVSNVSATSFYWLLQLRHVRRSLDSESAATLVHAFVTSRVDQCNAVLARATKSVTDTLQRVMNAAARVVSDTRKFDHTIQYSIRLLEAVRTQRRTIIEREKYVENENVKMVHNE